MVTSLHPDVFWTSCARSQSYVAVSERIWYLYDLQCVCVCACVCIMPECLPSCLSKHKTGLRGGGVSCGLDLRSLARFCPPSLDSRRTRGGLESNAAAFKDKVCEPPKNKLSTNAAANQNSMSPQSCASKVPVFNIDHADPRRGSIGNVEKYPKNPVFNIDCADPRRSGMLKNPQFCSIDHADPRRRSIGNVNK